MAYVDIIHKKGLSGEQSWQIKIDDDMRKYQRTPWKQGVATGIITSKDNVKTLFY